MRKKYLSALLFGALLFASAGTFTSCKDYDDDINGLRTEITDLKSTVTELQNAVENGKYVTAVSNSGNTITFTFSDGSTTPITLEDEKGSVVTVNEDGVLCIDGEPTDIKAATAEPDGEATKCQVIIGEDNCWQVLQEDGTYKTTNIPVSGVNVSGSEAEGYTLTIFNAAGDPTIVKLPSAASAISEIILAGDDQAPISLSLSSTEFVLGQNISSFDGSAFRKGWKGAKTLPENESYIVRPDDDAMDIKMRVNPVDVDASVVNFKLTNSLNQDLEGVTLNAIPENDAPAAGTPDGRAAAKGGLYKMAMEDLILANEDAWNDFDNAFSVTAGSVNFALNPNATVRSAYRIQVSDGADYTALDEIEIKDVTRSDNYATSAVTVTLDKGKTYTIVPGNGAIYDIMISADDEAVNNYGLTFDPATSSFTIGRDVDTSTSGKFTLNVTTVDVLGNVKDFTYNVELSEKVVDSILYDAVSYGVQSTNKVFGIDLSDMKESMTAEELNTWKTRVDFSKTSYKLYKEFKDGKVATEISSQIGTGSLLEGFITETINKDASSNVSSKDKANYISMLVDDSKANSSVKLFTTYYLEVIFNNGTPEELNRIIVPVQFTAPTVAEQFKVKSGLEKDGVVYGFLSDEVTSGNPAYTITDAFASSDANAKFTVTDDLIDDMDNVKSSAEFEILSNGDDVAFKDAVPSKADKTQDAYGKAFTLKAENAKYKATNWEYPDESKYTGYKFKMMLLSPIFDGKFSTSTGDALEVIGGADFKIVNSQLNTVDYNNTKFNMLPDVVSTTTGNQEFSDSRIAKVEVADYPGYFTETKVVVAKEDKDGNVVEGYIFGKAASVATDTDPLNLTVTVTDIFGYKKTVKIPVIIKANRTE